MNKSLLITRPQKDGEAFSKQVRKMNSSITTICSPLFDIEVLTVNPDLLNVNNVIITSLNAIRSLAKLGLKFEGTMYCVGNSSARLAQNEGYRSKSANGNIDDLIDLILSSVNKISERLVYFRGEQIAGDIGQSLRSIGYNVDEVICYRKKPNFLPPEVIDQITGGSIFGAVFFSKHTVNLFFNSVKNIPDGFVAFCISKDVSKTFISLYPKFDIVVRVASKPTRQAMCNLIVAAPEIAK